MAQKAGRKKIKNREQVQRALDLRKEGMTYAEIAAAMACSRTVAYKYVVSGLEELTTSLKETAVDVREMELTRLDAIISANWPQRGSWKNGELILKAMERRAKLLGLDAPTKLAQTTPDGEQEVATYDFSKLSTEELRAYIALCDKMGQSAAVAGE
jgi:hypothetical protein